MSTRSLKLTVLAGFTAAGLAAATMAFAAGTAPSSGSSGGGSSSTTSKCSQFKAKSAEWKKCVKGGRSAMNNEELYAAGYALAKNGDYADALEFLNAGTDKKDVRFLTMIGYSTRKLGKVDEGMGYYMQALALDPNSVTTREYLGEAYLQKKDLASAQSQLAEIQNRCGLTCESYTELKDEISKFQASL
jgi:tetratricopeptide (TPR) repeat protein